MVKCATMKSSRLLSKILNGSLILRLKSWSAKSVKVRLRLKDRLVLSFARRSLRSARSALRRPRLSKNAASKSKKKRRRNGFKNSSKLLSRTHMRPKLTLAKI